MSGLVIAGLFALLAGAGILIGARLPLGKLTPVATTLLLGLAGYAWQGSPGLAGKPVKPGAGQVKFDDALARKRTEIGERISGATRWLVVSDGLARDGDTEKAANVLLSGLREFPDDPNIWVGLGNALLVHGGGSLSPAADYSFRKAMALDSKGISAPYFYGLAMAESGQFERARDIWLRLAARLPEDMALREELIRNIALLNVLIRKQESLSQSGNPGP